MQPGKQSTGTSFCYTPHPRLLWRPYREVARSPRAGTYSRDGGAGKATRFDDSYPPAGQPLFDCYKRGHPRQGGRYMITGIRLGNFKAFAETQYIPIRPITLIFGPNSAGKSSILQSLMLMQHALDAYGDF